MIGKLLFVKYMQVYVRVKLFGEPPSDVGALVDSALHLPVLSHWIFHLLEVDVGFFWQGGADLRTGDRRTGGAVKFPDRSVVKITRWTDQVTITVCPKPLRYIIIWSSSLISFLLK